VADGQPPDLPAPAPFRETEDTAALLELIRAGDPAATERLVNRCLPALRRWAHGRLPGRARGMVDTDDLVQVSVLRALDQVGRFEPRREGAFLAYLRRILLNSVRDEIRRARRRPGAEELSEDLVDAAPGVIEEVIGREIVESYEAALAVLSEAQQEAVILRVEFGYSYPEIAEATGSPSANAARMTVARALARLAEAMDGRG
jgi:RNA polymerase sigma factor (sigma-70 family)